MATASARLDAVGIALSVHCLLHCLALPLIATGALALAVVVLAVALVAGHLLNLRLPTTHA